jgi:hypothetical protein
MLQEEPPQRKQSAIQLPTQKNYLQDFMMQSTDVYSVKKTHIPQHINYPPVKKTHATLDEPIGFQECNEIATQLAENHEVLREMKIPAQVAEMNIPHIIKKMGGNVNIAWTSNNDWQEIYYHGQNEYDIPNQNVAGYLHINQPSESSLETKESVMVSAEKEQKELDHLIHIINQQNE